MTISRQPIGKVIPGVDLTDLTEEQFGEIRDALDDYSVLVIPNQNHVTPKDQLALTKRFDTDANSYGHDQNIIRCEASILKNDGVTVPKVPEVHIIGHGTWTDVDGLPKVTLQHPDHAAFHRSPLSKDAIANNETRFYRWHIDAAFYDLSPPKVTTLQCLYTPEGPDQFVTLPDGDRLEVPLGTTAFLSGADIFQQLTPEEKEFALTTDVVYAPHPYIFISKAKAEDDGLTIASEGKETPLESLPPFEKQKVKQLPMVWTNPRTSRHHLQVHGCCVHKLITRSAHSSVVIDDIAEVRNIVHNMLVKSVTAENIYCHRWNIGDFVIFDNRGVMHSVVGQFPPGKRRLMHQCNLASNEDPVCIDENKNQSTID